MESDLTWRRKDREEWRGETRTVNKRWRKKKRVCGGERNGAGERWRGREKNSEED